MISPRPVLLASFAGGAIFATMLYPVLRLISRVLFPDPDPATIIWSAHAGFFWRVLTCLFAMALTSIALHVVYERTPEKLVRLLVPGVIVATVAISLQSLFVP